MVDERRLENLAGRCPPANPPRTPMPTPEEKIRLKPSERFRSVVNWAIAGEMATPQVAVANPAAKARATSAGAKGTVARKAERPAIVMKAAKSVRFAPKRRIAAAAGRQPARLPAVMTPETRPRKFSRNPN